MPDSPRNDSAVHKVQRACWLRVGNMQVRPLAYQDGVFTLETRPVRQSVRIRSKRRKRPT